MKSLFETPWTVAHQAPPSMEFSKQEYWSGLPFPSPGYLAVFKTGSEYVHLKRTSLRKNSLKSPFQWK